MFSHSDVYPEALLHGIADTSAVVLIAVFTKACLPPDLSKGSC